MLALVVLCAAAYGLSTPDVNVQPITTEVAYNNGKAESQKGLGFVIGRQFVTVYHNISPRLSDDLVRSQATYLGGFPVDPVFVNSDHDIAVFDIPTELCARWCDSADPQRSQPLVGARIRWPSPGNKSWSVAFAKELIVKGPQIVEFGSCNDNLVVEADAPFYPGSSGGPVIDSLTGEAIGVVQGSFTYADGRTQGYFKPLHCVFEMMGAAVAGRTHLAYSP